MQLGNQPIRCLWGIYWQEYCESKAFDSSRLDGLDSTLSRCFSPQFHVPTAKLCPLCDFTVREKVGGWRTQRNPWKYCERKKEHSVDLIPFISTQCLFYDPMHGIARLFSNFWVILRSACSFRECREFLRLSGILSSFSFLPSKV